MLYVTYFYITFTFYLGNYTCKAANTQPATVQVYVSDGE